MPAYVLLIFLSMIVKSESGRCRGRVNVGKSCTAICNFRVGRWLENICYPTKGDETISSPCEYTCGDSGQSCEFSYFGQQYELDPPVTGDCADPSGPCYVADIPDKCSEKDGECEYFCETPQDNSPPTCQYEYHQYYAHHREDRLPTMHGDCNHSSGPCREYPCGYGYEDYDDEAPVWL